VYVLDSTTIALPDALADLWQGCGGRTTVGTAAALKVQTELELVYGGLHGQLQAGRAQDHTAAALQHPHPAGSLRIQDLGYFSVGALARWAGEATFFLTRLKAGTTLVLADGTRWEVGAWLRTQTRAEVEQAVAIGRTQRLACRLLAVRVPPQVATERRRKLRAAAADKGQVLSARRAALADWTVLVTNVPADQLSVAEAVVLARVRWQIELVFKQWKAVGQVDAWGSQQPWRILCEVYAKLVALVIQHWVLLTGAWTAANRSRYQAAVVVRQDAVLLAYAVADADPAQVATALTTISRTLAQVGGVGRRRGRPATFQLVLDPTRQPRGGPADAARPSCHAAEPAA
jgi:hypothetical protein